MQLRVNAGGEIADATRRQSHQVGDLLARPTALELSGQIKLARSKLLGHMIPREMVVEPNQVPEVNDRQPIKVGQWYISFFRPSSRQAMAHTI